MASKSDIHSALYAELKTVLSNETAVTTPKDHAGLLQRVEDVAYPFIGFQSVGRPENHGIRGNVHVDEILTDASGEFDGIRYRRDFVLSTDIVVQTDDGDAVTKDDLYTALVDHFQSFRGDTAGSDPTDLHADVNWIDPGGFEGASSPSDGIRGDRHTMELSFSRYRDVTSSLSKMDTIDLTIEDDETGADYLTDTID